MRVKTESMIFTPVQSDDGAGPPLWLTTIRAAGAWNTDQLVIVSDTKFVDKSHFTAGGATPCRENSLAFFDGGLMHIPEVQEIAFVN
jgi:hypothetical protein